MKSFLCTDDLDVTGGRLAGGRHGGGHEELQQGGTQVYFFSK